MLVLMRKLGERITIGHDVTVEVVEIDRGKVRLGIVAPREVPVHRQEVYDEIYGERKVSDAEGQSANDVGQASPG